MGKICLPTIEDCQIQFYSIADDLQNLTNYIFEFLLNMTPGMLLLIILTLIGLMVIYILFIINKSTKNVTAL